MRGLVAQVEGELFLVRDLAGCRIIAGGFETEGATAEPMVLGHGFHEHDLRDSLWLVLFAEGDNEFVEIGLRFGGEDAESSGQTVTSIIQSGGRFSGFAFRAGG